MNLKCFKLLVSLIDYAFPFYILHFLAFLKLGVSLLHVLSKIVVEILCLFAANLVGYQLSDN